MKQVAILSGLAALITAFAIPPAAQAQALNVQMPLGSACPAGYHWEMANGFAQCVADAPPVPIDPPVTPPSASCSGSWPGYYDSPGTFVYIGFWDIANGDIGGRGPGMFVWYNGTKIYENRYLGSSWTWDAVNDASRLMPAGYSVGPNSLGSQAENGNGTFWVAFTVCH